MKLNDDYKVKSPKRQTIRTRIDFMIYELTEMQNKNKNNH